MTDRSEPARVGKNARSDSDNKVVPSGVQFQGQPGQKFAGAKRSRIVLRTGLKIQYQFHLFFGFRVQASSGELIRKAESWTLNPRLRESFRDGLRDGL